MPRKFKNYRVLALAVSLLFAAAGCGSSNPGSLADAQNSGTIKLTISQKSGTKTILPNIDMTPAAYTINGTGPNGAEVNLSISDVSVDIPELAFGNWIISVDALNANDQLIARGSGAFSVHTGETTSADITVTPLAGNGTLTVTLEWNSDDTEVPSIEAQLINSSDEVQDLSFTINSEKDTGTFSASDIPAGYYVLSVKLLDNNIQTMGAVEIVRIVEGKTSTGSFIFNEINKPGGNIIANILADMEEPIEVSMSDIPGELAKGTTPSVTASVPDGVGDVRYTWFINGEQTHIGSTADPIYTIPVDSLKTGGVYRIDVVAFTIDGKRGGSASDSFNVTESQSSSTWAKVYKGLGGWVLSDNLIGVGCGKAPSDPEEPDDVGVVGFKLDSEGDIDWLKIYDAENSFDTIMPFFTSVPTNNGGMINIIKSQHDYILMKIDSAGSIIWNYAITESFPSSSSNVTYPFRVQKAEVGYFIFRYYIDIENRLNIAIIKIDEDGNINLAKNIINETEDFSSDLGSDLPFFNIIETNDNGYMITYLLMHNSFVKIKLNSDFSIQWQRIYEDNSNNNYVFSEIETSNEGFLLSGGAEIDKNDEKIQAFLVMLRNDGTIEWQKRFAISDNGMILHLIAEETGYISAGALNGDTLLLKLNHDGTANWIKTYGLTGTYITVSLNKTGSSGYLISGYGELTPPETDEEDEEFGMFLFKTDENGDIANTKSELTITSIDPGTMNAAIDHSSFLTSSPVNYHVLSDIDITLVPVDPSTYSFTDVPLELMSPQIEIIDLCN
ncbi:MAG: hypothetical protein GY754_02445 [bacterium]|nr:hypothetical protein [bacterium]